MKTLFALIFFLLALTACTSTQVPISPAPTATDNPQVGIPNPASVYCKENGNILEIRTADDGSQYGMCVFPDGSTCEEWAYFRGECDSATHKSPTPDIVVEATAADTSDASGGFMEPGTSEEIADWWGVIRKTELGRTV